MCILHTSTAQHAGHASQLDGSSLDVIHRCCVGGSERVHTLEAVTTEIEKVGRLGVRWMMGALKFGVDSALCGFAVFGD